MKNNKEIVLKVITFFIIIIIIGIGLLVYKLMEKSNNEIILNDDLKNEIEIDMIDNVVFNEVEIDEKKYTLEEYDNLEEKTGVEIVIHNGQEYSGFDLEYLNICRNTWFSRKI